MQKILKRTLSLILVVVLCLSALPLSAFASELTPGESGPTNESSGEASVDSSQPDSGAEPTASPTITATPGPEESLQPEESTEPQPTPEATPSPAPSAEPDGTPEPSSEPDNPYETELSQMEATQIWPALRRARARAAAGVGTAGVLQMGYYCFKSEVGTLTTLGEYVSQLPAKTMLINGTNIAAYCLEHEKGATGGTPYTWADMSVNAQDTVGTIMALGFQWSAADFWNGPSDNGDKWAVTQLLIWETINGHAFMQGDGLFGVEAAVDADMEKCAPHAYNPTKFLQYYRDLKKRLNDYMKIPSFANKSADKANTITMRWDGNKYSASVTDTNGVLSNYNFAGAIPGVTISANGNSLTLSTSEAIPTPKTSSRIRNQRAATGGKGAVAVWRTSDASQQSFATYNADGGEPVSCYIKVKTDATGTAGLVKTAEDGKVSGISFRIDGSDGSSTTKTTDANGNIDIDGLPIYDASGKKITYTATELNVPNRYIKPQSKTFQLTEGQTTSVQFENRLKKWRVNVTKSDSKTGSTPQGNGSLKGAKYGVYKGNELVKEYTTDEKGQFTTDYYPYGDDWTLREITASPGYQVSTVVTKLCEIPAGSTQENNENTAAVKEDILRGGLSIEKRDSVTGKTPQGDASFAGIVFEIVNKSKNPVEVDGKVIAPGQVAKEITTNAQGIATTGPNALPYGDYLVREKATNASMRKTFTEEISVKVAENGKVYTFTAENDVVRGGLAVQKRDSQTGETPQGNADFAGIVFEVVNSSANAVVVGGETFAPGQVVTTLTTNENGYASTANDLLPYGRYTVREKSTNASMLLTFQPQTVNVNEDKKLVTVTANDDVVRGGLSVEKRDSQTGATPQGDANFAGIVFEIINDSRNPVMVDGTSCAPGKVVKEISTNDQGMAATGPNDLPYGDYIVREKSTNASMLKTFTEEIHVTVSENGKVYTFTAENDVVRGGIAIEKHDSQTGATPQGNADFAGITFEIVNNSANPVVVGDKTCAPGEVVATMTTDENGHASTADDALPFGRYLVREKETNKSMLLTWPEQEVTVSENKKVYSVTAVDDVVRGGLAVEKRDSVTGSTPQGDADFEGITFEVINNSRNPVIVNDKSIAPGEVALTLTTDSEGKCSSAPDALPYGEYILRESATNDSMLNTAPDQTVTIDEHLKVYDFQMDNEVVRGGILIEKRDLESKLLTPLGGASLDGTLFEITNKSRNAVYVDGALYEPETVCLTIEVKDGVAQSDVRALPYGTYTLSESKPGVGYLWTDKKVRDFTVRKDGEVTEFREGDAAYNQVKRGDLKFVKVGEKNMHRFANVAFKLTSQTTGESHILCTDQNGEVRTETKWNAHSLNTNGNDDKADGEWTDEAGTWFGKTTEDWMVETQDGLCALPYDYYTLEELRCEGNKGYALVTVPNIFISRDSTVIELGTIDDHEEGMPEIGTTATVDGEKTAEPLSEVTLVDTVRYSGLTAGKTYKLSGVLMEKETGKPLEIDGKQVTAEKEFTPKSESGIEELSYTFNASALAGKSVVVFEDLFEGENKVASHADIEDEGQTVTFTEPKIGTTATANGEHTAQPVGEITIVDTVKYSGLIPGKEYTVKGVLMDKATGKALMVEDKEITAEATFRASKDEGSINIPFTFDASALAGKTVVAFETLYRDKLEVAVHADIEDEDQTVTFSEKPDIKTTATVNGEKKVKPVEKITITDTVSYTGLTPGKTYKLSGVLMDKASGAPLLVDGQQVTAEKEFTPDNASGTEEMAFTFDASALAGKSVVVFESLYHEGKEVAVHTDISDKDQTVEFEEPDKPEIRTKATVDNEKKAEPKEKVTITDTVSYTGLTPGKPYKLSGVLMDKASGAPLLVDGQQITAEKEFTPESAAGTEEIAFTFDASALAGKSVVVFETLYHEGKEVAAHADIDDLGQTVEFEGPEIKTKATVNGEKEVDPLETVTLTDTVTYRNLIPGKTYQVKGVLMDKGTGEKLLVDGKEVTAESIFIPEKPTGKEEITFTFPASALAGKTIVVFESLYHEAKEVAVHADLEDEDQTIVIRRKGGLLIRKTSEDDFVEGISFIVAGEGYEETFKTDKRGEIYVQDLVPGEYTVTEVENDVTVKYIIEAGKTVTITSGDEVAEVEFHNKLKRGSVYVVKTAEGAPSENLSGAEFAVYADVDGNAEFDPETDTLFGKLKYAEKEYSLDGLPMGGYFIHEEKAPEGYTADDGYYFFKLTEDGERVEVTNTADKEAGFVNKKQTGSLRIVKVEKGTTTPLAGATFCVKDENGQVVAEGKTDTDGVIVFEDLPFGSYVYQEVYAPEGYKLDDTEHKFEINGKNNQVEVTAENEKIPTTPSKDVPKTGDTRPNPWLIGGAALLMLACAGRLLWYLLKHRRA